MRKGNTMNKDDREYHFTHSFDELLVPTLSRSPIGKQMAILLLLQIVASPDTNASGNVHSKWNLFDQIEPMAFLWLGLQ